MSKKLIFLSVLFLLFAANAQADLVAYYPFEDNANDMSGYGTVANGTLVGTPTFEAGPTNFGQALKINTGNYVNCGADSKFSITGPITVCAWVKISAWTTAWNAIVTKGDTTWRLHRNNATDNINFTCSGVTGGSATGTTNVNDGKWHHLAGVWDGANIFLYVDGIVDGTAATTGGSTATTTLNMMIGENATYTGRPYNGWIDEVRIYNTALSAGEVLAVMTGKKGLPSKPKPASNASEVSVDVGEVSWTPGEYANTHNVFIGTNFDDVNEATTANPLGATVYAGLLLDSNSIDLARLAYGTTYYWKVEEVNLPSKPGTITGSIWSFKTELKGYPLAAASIINVTASDNCAYPGEQEPNFTSKGLGIDANDAHSDNYKQMWLGMAEELGQIWIQYEFDKVYKLNDMLVWNYNEPNPGESYGAKDVNIAYSLDGLTWESLGGTVQFNPATGLPDYKANTTIDFDGAVAKFVKLTFWSAWDDSLILGGVSEVRFSAIPTRAQAPVPANAAANRAIDQILSWKAGRGADTHKLYIGTDSNSVRDGLVTAVELDEASYSPVLDLSKTYYWKVDEVNTAEVYTTWEGTVWNFKTSDSRVIDGFEVGYDDSDANAVWVTWTGYADPANGGAMGNAGVPYLSTNNHSGGHSSPMYYNNTGSVKPGATKSEVTAQVLDLPIGSADWTIGSPVTLTIWFRGDAANVIGDEELYCTIGGKTAVYGGNLTAYLKGTEWKQWDIDLATLNANLSNIPQITIGIRKVGATGGSGIIYLDDIQLTGLAAKYVGMSIYFEAETMTLTGIWRGAQTSQTGFNGTGYIDTLNTQPSITEPNLTGLATYAFTSDGGKYMVNIRYRPSYSTTWRNSFFVLIINGSGTPAATDVTLQTANGWVNCDELAFINPWGWDTIYNRDASNVNADVTWTLPAGNYTIQFSYKETGPKLDTVEIMKVSN